jgi:hypothetical protein
MLMQLPPFPSINQFAMRYGSCSVPVPPITPLNPVKSVLPFIIIGSWIVCAAIPTIFLVGVIVSGCGPFLLLNNMLSLLPIVVSLLPVIGMKTKLITKITTTIPVAISTSRFLFSFFILFSRMCNYFIT